MFSNGQAWGRMECRLCACDKSTVPLASSHTVERGDVGSGTGERIHRIVYAPGKVN